jgi:Holliday junction resolvasome RuvABC ATP-dependent DNA helicase subunit
MNETTEILDKFVTAFRNRSVPPPHILLVGPDEQSNANTAKTFASKLGVEFKSQDCRSIDILGDLSLFMFCKGVAYLGNIHKLKKQFIERLDEALQHGFYEISIGEGEGANSSC